MGWTDRFAPPSRDSVAAVAVSIIVNAVVYLWLKPSVAAFSPLARPLIRPAIGLNVVSLGLILSSAWWWANWRNRLPLVLRLDLAASLILPALFWWASHTKPSGGGEAYLGIVYVGAIACKGALLVFHALNNAPREGNTRSAIAYVGFVSFVIYSAITPWVSIKAFATGDEPHYLLEAHSLIYDHDLDLSNNYVNGDSNYYTPGNIPDHHTVINSQGQELPFHDVGLPVILLPGIVLGGRLGAIREMNFLAALLALGIYVLAARFAPSGSAAILTWALFAFTSPLIVFSSQIYPEVPGALLAIAAVLSFEKYRAEGVRAYLWLTGWILAALPWLSMRYWLVVGAIATAALLRGSVSVGRRALDSVPLILPLLLATLVYSMVDWKLYGVPIPNAGFLIKHAETARQLRLSDPVVGFLGLFFDRARGLLANSPIYLTVFGGVAVSLRRRRALGSLLLAGALGGVAAASNQLWAGGWCPPSRLMLVSAALAVPLAAPALLDRRVRFAALVLAVWSFFVAAAYSAFPIMRYTPDTRSGELGRWFQTLCGIDPMWIFPALVRARLIDFLLAGFWCLLAVGCALWFTWPGRAAPGSEEIGDQNRMEASLAPLEAEPRTTAVD